jgi:hypothetical protein
LRERLNTSRCEKSLVVVGEFPARVDAPAIRQNHTWLLPATLTVPNQFHSSVLADGVGADKGGCSAQQDF